MPPTQLAIRKNEDLATYPGLFRQVKAVLLDGQRRIENERIFTFWDAGRLIRTHILLNQERAEYGKGVILKLAQDLHVSRQVLDRCVQFFETYPKFPIGARARQLTWSHYQELIAVADDKKRLLLEKAIITSGLTRDEVRARKKAQQPSEPTTSLTPEVRKVAPLVPLRGELYTYKILKPKPLAPGVESALVIDLGFSVTRDVEPRLVSNFSDGDVVASIPKEDAYRFSKSDRTAQDLYTYNAYVEKVIDGDTLKARIDLGFDIRVRESLRLRGIDCPELKTRDGDAAKAFVQSLIKEADRIVIRSQWSDKYGRYLADIFIPAADGGEEVYLNNLLMEKGHAVRYE